MYARNAAGEKVSVEQSIDQIGGRGDGLSILALTSKSVGANTAGNTTVHVRGIRSVQIGNSMKRTFINRLFRTLAFVVAALGLTIGLQADEPVATEKPRMLMVTQSKGFAHQSVKRQEQLISPAEKAMKQLAHRSGLFEVDFSQDAAAHLTRENLQNYDIVAFYTSGDLPVDSDDLKYFLNEWVKQPGHGFLGFHSASDTYKEHEPYWDFVGGTFDSHPWTSNAEVTLVVHDPDHPTMKPFGKEFEIQEEIYQYQHWQPSKVRVLMSIDMSKTETKRPYHVPVAWVKQVGEGRMYYNNLGHRPETWKNEQFLKSIEGAIGWFQGTENGESTPNPEVSKQQQTLSEEAARAAGDSAESPNTRRSGQSSIIVTRSSTDG